MAHASLLVVQGPDQGARIDLEGDSLIIGRGSGQALCLSDSEVSREHARLDQHDGRWTVSDLGSSNGTFVNGEATRLRALSPGDQIQIGRTVLVLQSGDKEAASPAAAVDFVETPADSARIVGSLPNTADLGFGRILGEWSAARRPAANLQVLYQVTEEIARPTARLEDLLQRILQIALPAVGADRGCMLVADSRTDRIEPRVVVRRSGVPENERFPVSRSIVQYVIQNGVAVRTADASRDERFAAGESILTSGIREAMCAPMHGRFELLGVLYVDTTAAGAAADPRRYAARFDDDQLALLAAIGRQAASAIESARYQQALIESERMAAVGRTTAFLSHHIKNILQGVRGGSYLIDRGLKDANTPLIEKGWKIVERNQERIYRLVLDMLSFSKERRPELRTGDVNQLVGEVCDLMQPHADEVGVRIERRLASQLPPAAFDAEAMHQAFLNLLVNALEALDGTADACATAATDYDSVRDLIVIEVADNGPGIPPEELPLIFNAFESSKGARGTGLGLAVSRKILREHGGDLTVESAPGQGARFRMAWPRLDAPPPAAGAPAAE